MKKVFNYILIFFFLGVIVYVGYFIFLEKDNNYLNIINQDKIINSKLNNKIESKIDEEKHTNVNICNWLSDKESFKKAVEWQNLDFCNCIKDIEKQTLCKAWIKDTLLYLQAINQFDESICNQILDNIQKEACLSIVLKSIEKFQKEDPIYLSQIYERTHNEKNISLLEAKEIKNFTDYIKLSFFYSEKWLKEQEKGIDYKESLKQATKYIEKAKKLNPNNTEVFRAEAYLNEIKWDIIKSIDLYTKSIELDKTNYLSYVWRWHAYNILWILDEALKDFNKAKSLNKTNDFLYMNLCRLEYSRSDLLDNAIEDCNIVIDKWVDLLSKSEAYQILANIYIDKNDLNKAEDYLIQAEVLTPNNANLYVWLSDFYLLKEDYKKAEEKALKWISIYKTKSILYLKLWSILNKQWKSKEAIKQIKKGLDLVDNDVSLLFPYKSSVKREFYYLLSDIYLNLWDNNNQIKYKVLWDKEFNN